MIGPPALRTLIFGFHDAAQFHMVAGRPGEMRPEHIEWAGSLAASAQDDAVATGLPAGRAHRRGSHAWHVIAMPTTVSETMSGRSGLAISFVIAGEGSGRTPTGLLLRSLASFELALSRAHLGEAVGLEVGAQLLAAELQGAGEGAAFLQRLNEHVDNAGAVLSAVARQRRRLFRPAAHPGAVDGLRTESLPYRLLATLADGARSCRRVQQGLVVRLGDPPPALTRTRAHHFLRDLVIISQDAAS